MTWNFRGSSNAFILKFDAVSCKLAMLALAAQFRVREPFVQNQSGTFCLQRLVIIIHSLMDVFKRIATLLDPSSVNENTRKLQYNIFVYISSTVGHLRRF